MNLSDIITQGQLEYALAKWYDGDHCPVGSSSVGRAVWCNASPVMGLLFGVDDNGRDAQEGTSNHALIASAIETGKSTGTIHEDNALAFVNDIRSHYGKGLEGIEEKVFIGNEHGTLDYRYIAGERGIVIDWKTGYESEDYTGFYDYQIAFLSNALLIREKWLQELVGGCAFTDQNAPGKVHSFTREGIESYLAFYNGLLSRCRSLDASFADTYCPERCKYCKAKGACPVLAERNRTQLAVLDSYDLSKVEDADRFKLALKMFDAQLKSGDKAATETIRNAGGSEHFRVQGGGEYDKTSWKELAMHLMAGCDDDERNAYIAGFTMTSTRAASVVMKKGGAK